MIPPTLRPVGPPVTVVLFSAPCPHGKNVTWRSRFINRAEPHTDVTPLCTCPCDVCGRRDCDGARHSDDLKAVAS